MKTLAHAMAAVLSAQTIKRRVAGRRKTLCPHCGGVVPPSRLLRHGEARYVVRTGTRTIKG